MSRLPYKELQIWQKAIQLAKKAYALTDSFPQKEIYGLTSQARKSAVSVPSNIAEGSRRNTEKDFSHFISIARGSLAELETQIILPCEFGYINKESLEVFLNDSTELSKMLRAFHEKID